MVSFPPVSPPRPYIPLSSPVHTTCPAHLILLDFITRTILGEEYRSFSSSLCNILHSPVTSSLQGPNILLNTMFSNTLSFLSFSFAVSFVKSCLWLFLMQTVLLFFQLAPLSPMHVNVPRDNATFVHGEAGRTNDEPHDRQVLFPYLKSSESIRYVRQSHRFSKAQPLLYLPAALATRTPLTDLAL